MAVLLEDQVKALEKNTPKVVVLTVLIIAEIMILVMGKEQNT